MDCSHRRARVFFDLRRREASHLMLLMTSCRRRCLKPGTTWIASMHRWVLQRGRRDLRQILSGPLRNEAEAFGFALDEALAEGWQETRLWCPLCARCRLQGCFVTFEGGEEGQKGPNLHLRCPDCSRRYGQDTIRSMGLVSLAGLRSFTPACKRTMQVLTDGVL